MSVNETVLCRTYSESYYQTATKVAGLIAKRGVTVGEQLVAYITSVVFIIICALAHLPATYSAEVVSVTVGAYGGYLITILTYMVSVGVGALA